MELEIISKIEETDAIYSSDKLRLLYELELQIISDMQNLRLDALSVAGRLKEIQVKRLFEELDYLLAKGKKRNIKNIYEYAFQVFKFKRTSVKNMLAVHNTFCERDRFATLKPRYQDYSFTQLVEMVSLTQEQREHITPDMTVAQIRSYKAMLSLDQKNDEEEEPKPKKSKQNKPVIVFMVDYGKMKVIEVDIADNDRGIYSTPEAALQAIEDFKHSKASDKDGWVV